MFIIECEYVQLLIKFEDVVQNLLVYVTLWCLFIDPHRTTHQSNICVQLRKVIDQHLYSFWSHVMLDFLYS